MLEFLSNTKNNFSFSGVVRGNYLIKRLMFLCYALDYCSLFDVPFYLWYMGIVFTENTFFSCSTYFSYIYTKLLPSIERCHSGGGGHGRGKKTIVY